MNKERYNSLIETIGNFTVDSYELYSEIRNSEPRSVKSRWLNEKSKHVDLYGLPDMSKEHTYSGCVSITMLKDYRVEIVIWDGDAYDGFPKNKRCMFQCTVNKKLLIPYLKEQVLHYAKREEEREERARRQNRVDEIYNTLLNPSQP